MTPEAKKLLETIQEALEKYPEMRVGQLLSNVMGYPGDIFYTTDEEFTRNIKEWLEKMEWYNNLSTEERQRMDIEEHELACKQWEEENCEV